MNKDKLDKILEDHKKWLVSYGKGGRKANLIGAFLQGANLIGACLRGAYLRGAYLQGAYLQGADLEGADLEKADLRGAFLQGACLRGANLRGAYLQGIKGKTIIKFQANKHFAYYCDGYVRIGCICKSLKEWLVEYKEIGNKNGYSDQDIELYGDWLKSLKDIKL